MNEATIPTSVIITNFNGQDLLEKYLPSIIREVDTSLGHEIIVADDCSTENDIEFLQNNFPEITVFQMEQNSGFGKVANAAVRSAKNEIVIILNNDIEAGKGFLAHLTKHFTSKDIFCVTTRVFNEGNNITGRISGSVQWGKFKLSGHNKNGKLEEETSPTLFGGGGSAAFHKEKFLELGGFDELFNPYYWEDVDLCYRGWKRGWETSYEPKSILYHRHIGSTIKRISTEKQISRVWERNHLIHVWKNISDTGMLLPHIFILPLVFVKALITGNFPIVLGIIDAIKKIPVISEKKKLEEKTRTMSDREILLKTS